MMRTLRDMNMSKFVAEDVPLFLSLIDDLFPGTKAERAQFADVQAALLKVYQAPKRSVFVSFALLTATCLELSSFSLAGAGCAWPCGAPQLDQQMYPAVRNLLGAVAP